MVPAVCQYVYIATTGDSGRSDSGAAGSSSKDPALSSDGLNRGASFNFALPTTPLSKVP